MYIKRDIEHRLKNIRGSYVQILVGPHQCGKSTQFAVLSENKFHEITFDDLQMRQLAERDPALFLAQFPYPLLIDEVQYAPNIFPEIKRLVDHIKREKLLKKSTEPVEVIFRLTGSNQILLDTQVKETLVGRASYFYMNTLSVHEIKQAFPDMRLNQFMFQGGWPELYSNPNINIIQYLNDYI